MGMALVLAWAGGKTAEASAVLTATKGSSRNLQPRAIDISTSIDGAWAQTTVTTVYANANPNDIEADFIYSAPPGSVVTGFAYWYGKEKVVARIVEKERAKKIYQATKDAVQPVDPALVEMIGKNLFRARINPVAANEDLRVEIKLAQPLATEKGALVWNYPLPADTSDVTLDWFRAIVEVKNGAGALNNYGAPLTDGQFTIKKYNFKPITNLRVSLPQTPSPLTANLVAEHKPMGAAKVSDDAFFALSLRSPFAMSGMPKISGVKTFEVLPPEKSSPGEIRISGRYRGKGAATVSWGRYQTVTWFPPSTDTDNEISGLAAPLWGAARIEGLSKDASTRLRVIALSQQFGLPSKWTSWLAMPAEERKKFNDEIRRIDLNSKGEQWARTWIIETENGRQYSPLALRARAELRALTRSSIGRKFGFDEENARKTAIEHRFTELAHLAVTRQLGLGKGDAGARAKMTRLAAITDKTPGTYLQSAQHELRLVQVHSLASRWKAEVMALREATPQAKRLKKQLTALSERTGAEQDFESDAYTATAQQLAQTVLNEALRGREAGLRAARLIDVAERYTRRLGEGNFRTTFYDPAIADSLAAANDRLLTEVEAGRDLSPLALSARTRIRQLYALAPNLRSTMLEPGSKEWEVDRAVRGRAHEMAYRLAQTKRKRPNDTATQSRLQADLDRITTYTDADSSDFEKFEDRRIARGEPLLNARQYQLRPGDPLITVDAPRDAHVVAVLPSGEVRPLGWSELAKKWETRFDVPAYAHDGKYVIQILIVRADGSRSRFTMPFAVDTVAPKAQAQAAATDTEHWHLTLWTQSTTERVVALLPWKVKTELTRQKAGLFAANTNVPALWCNRPAKVRFIVTDKAHNRTELLVDWSS